MLKVNESEESKKTDSEMADIITSKTHFCVKCKVNGGKEAGEFVRHRSCTGLHFSR